MKDSTSLKDIFKFYCSSHSQIKKFWKKKSKSLEEAYHFERVEKELVQEKKGKKLLNKKQARKDESEEEDSEEESKVQVKAKKTEKNDTPTPVTKNSKIEKVENTKTSNGASYNGNSNTPFKRINDSLKDVLPENLQDNSYEKFMNTTGENYGKEANEKLKFTKGRDFKKEKTKFKNKTAFGGLSISTQVRSIPLDTDSD